MPQNMNCGNKNSKEIPKDIEEGKTFVMDIVKAHRKRWPVKLMLLCDVIEDTNASCNIGERNFFNERKIQIAEMKGIFCFDINRFYFCYKIELFYSVVFLK